MDGQFESIVHVVLKHAREKSAHDAIIFLARGETETERVSYGEFGRMIRSRAEGFAAFASLPVVIAMPPGASFAATFLGALHAGAIAVPVPLPDNDKSVARFLAVLADCRPEAVVTTKEFMPRLEELAAGPRILDADDLNGPSCAPPVLTATEIAFVQYTSGSTRAPKGIAITHGNLMANQRMIQSAFGTNENTVGVNWLPHFHDMGLIGTILHPLFLGGTAVLMPPRAFVQKPIRWLRAIEKYRGDVAGGPGFAFELCTRMTAPDQARALDLSSWRVAFCGAEPIRAAALNGFSERFAEAGFRKTTFLPCYGLAEATLICSCAAGGEGLTERKIAAWSAQRNFVSCGAPVPGGTIVLRDTPGAIVRSEGGTGEICVAGPHVAPGYWDGAARTIAPFEGTFDEDGTTWLPTGDLGAFADDELYVIDRLRDFLILYGAKIHAADIEATVLEEPEVRAAAAFATDDGARETLVVLCETGRRTQDASLAERLARRVAEVHGIVPKIHPLAHGALPRTSSGKIQRIASRTKFLSGELALHKVETT